MTDIVELLKMAARNRNALAGEAADEIERLRAQIKFGSCTTRITNNGIDVGHCTLKPEVERLRADNARLRAALREIAEDDIYLRNCATWHDTGKMKTGVQAFARAALENK